MLRRAGGARRRGRGGDGGRKIAQAGRSRQGPFRSPGRYTCHEDCWARFRDRIPGTPVNWPPTPRTRPHVALSGSRQRPRPLGLPPVMPVSDGANNDVPRHGNGGQSAQRASQGRSWDRQQSSGYVLQVDTCPPQGTDRASQWRPGYPQGPQWADDIPPENASAKNVDFVISHPNHFMTMDYELPPAQGPGRGKPAKAVDNLGVRTVARDRDHQGHVNVL